MDNAFDELNHRVFHNIATTGTLEEREGSGIASIVRPNSAFTPTIDERQCGPVGDLQDCKMTLASPVRRLPHELLAEIIHVYCANETPAPRSILVPTHVCALWRTVAFEAPCIWTRLQLYRSQATSLHAIKHAEGWFRRAGSLPVTFEVYGTGKKQAYPMLYDTTLASLSRLSPKIGELDIYGHSLRFRRG